MCVNVSARGGEEVQSFSGYFWNKRPINRWTILEIYMASLGKSLRSWTKTFCEKPRIIKSTHLRERAQRGETDPSDTLRNKEEPWWRGGGVGRREQNPSCLKTWALLSYFFAKHCPNHWGRQWDFRRKDPDSSPKEFPGVPLDIPHPHPATQQHCPWFASLWSRPWCPKIVGGITSFLYQ